MPGKIDSVTEWLAAETDSLSRIIDAVAVPIFVKDREHRWLLLNDACCALIGRSRAELIGKSDYDFFPKAQADVFWAKDEEVFATGRENVNEEVFTDAKGNVHTLSTRKTLCALPSGAAVLVGAADDITERKRTMMELQHKSSLLAAQSEASREGILVVNEQGGIISFNDRFVEIWEIPPEVIRSKSDQLAIESVLSKVVDSDQFAAKIRYLYDHRGESSHDEILLRDGRTIDRYSSSVVGNDGRYFGRVWFFRDTTELRRLEQLRAEIQQRRKLDELKDSFLATVTHELRTPLTVVKGIVDSLDGQPDDALPPQLAATLGMCRRNIARLEKMINNLLDVSRLESGRAKVMFRRFWLNALLDDAVGGLRMTARGRNVEFAVDVPPGDLECCADPDMIMEVLINLLDNAARLAKSRVCVSVDRQKDSYRIEVADDGPGIPLERVGDLFDKFVQVARSTEGRGYKGTGLGLTICKDILALHDSKMEVESRPGQGAVFRFRLRRCTPDCGTPGSDRRSG